MELLHVYLQIYQKNLTYVYKDDFDLSRLKTQLLMLPGLIATRNRKNSVQLKKITTVRTICEIIKETSTGREKLFEVIKLKIFSHCLQQLLLQREVFQL